MSSLTEGPADRYLNSTNYTDWDIIHYIQSNNGISTDVLLGSWWRALRRFAGDPCEERVKRAVELLAAKDNDSIRVRDFNQRTTASTGHVTIQNSTVTGFSLSIVHNKRDKRERRNGQRRKRRAKRNHHRTQQRQLDVFQARLRSLDKDKLWILKPNKSSVEERLGQYILANNVRESPAHSFIVDTSDDDIRGLFDDDEWRTIKGVVETLPGPDNTLEQYLKAFLNTSTIDGLKDILEKGAYYTVSTEDMHGPLRREKYANLEWAHYVLSSLVRDYGTTNITRLDNREKWYQSHIWTPIVDRLFECIPNVRYVSGECPTNATSSRRNPKGKSPGVRMNPGCLHDGVIKYFDYELGATENGGSNIGPGHVKWTSDTLKVVKSDRDMIVRLLSGFGSAGEHVPTLGIVTGGLSLKTVRMRYGGGSSCVLVHDSVIQLPTTIHHFGPLTECIVRMWQIKEMTERATGVITTLLNIPNLAPPPTAKLVGSIDTGGETSADESSEDR